MRHRNHPIIHQYIAFIYVSTTEEPVADLSAQALISLHLQEHFPSDPIIGEEDTTELRANAPLRERVVALVNDAFEQQDGWGKGKTVGEEEVLKAVDAGSSEGGREGRFWTIDPGMSISRTLGIQLETEGDVIKGEKRKHSRIALRITSRLS